MQLTPTHYALRRNTLDLCEGGQNEVADGRAARGLAEDGDAGRVSAEVRDVLLHPLEGRHHVQHAHVARGLVRVQAHEAWSGKQTYTYIYRLSLVHL
jgi:hypothetical protein